MIRAVNKYGEERYFSKRIWDMLPKNRAGWVLWEDTPQVSIPLEVIEFQQKFKEYKDEPEKKIEKRGRKPKEKNK